MEMSAMCGNQLSNINYIKAEISASLLSLRKHPYRFVKILIQGFAVGIYGEKLVTTKKLSNGKWLNRIWPIPKRKKYMII